MPIASARISDELHDQVKIESELQGVSISDFIRKSIEDAVNGRIQSEEKKPSIEDSPAFALLSEQLKEKDQQISQLHQLVAMSQKHSDDLANQLEQTTKQLEDQRQNGKWWRFWSAKQK